MDITVEKLKDAKIRTVTVMTEDERTAAEKEALNQLANHIEIKGFRAGKAPHDKVRERIGAENLIEETVRVLLPKVLKAALEKSEAKPILRPSANILKKDPLTIEIVFINRPAVSIKKPEKITVEKKKPADVTTKDVDGFISKVLEQDRTETPVDREAQKGDVVHFAIKTTKKGTQVDALTIPAYDMVLGAEETLPELEEHLIGMKKGDSKTAQITFPKDHDIEAIRGEKLQVEMTLKSVATVKVPELTQEYIKERLKTDKTPEALRTDIETMLASRRMEEEMRRREEELYEKIRAATSVEIAPELIETEVQDMVRDLHERLEKQGTSVQDWLQMTGKTEKSVADEMRDIAKSRTILRFGMQELADALKIEPEADVLSAALVSAQAHAKTSGSRAKPEDFLLGGTVYENLHYELRMRALQKHFLGQENQAAA
jgi:trigger factor